MADDTAAVRQPQITDMPAVEAYAFLTRQISLATEYAVRAERAAHARDWDRSTREYERHMLLFKQICRDLMTITVGAPVWETQP